MNENELQNLIEKASRIVFFGGAGVSTGSRIPDFRGANGLEKETAYGGLTMEMILSKSFFHLHPDLFYEYYREHLLFPDAMPNPAHLVLAEMERKNCLAAVVTQNIDGLHQKAGSRAVYPLHGSIFDNYCLECGRRCALEVVLRSEGVPRCPSCGGVIRPGITLYGEAPDPLVMRGACREIARCDLLIVAGTSLRVEPAASCLSYFHGKALVVINEEPLEIDQRATLCIHGRVEEVLGTLRVPEKPKGVRKNWWS
ncbi:MAG: NAD-dependent protein deacylase [Clostridia bacterium]|nr:NAD-dependent protein deacylase [Clostridia bacterium]